MTAQNIPLLFLEQAYKYGPRDFLRVKRNGAYTGLSWEFVLHEVAACSEALFNDGVTSQSCVAILSENRPEWAIADLAILSLGAVTVPVYATSTPAEIAYILRHSEAQVIFVSGEEQMAKVASIRGEYPTLRYIVKFDLPVSGKDVLFLTDFIRGSVGKISFEKFEERIRRIRREDLASVIYTSGTTGPPKGVMLTHANFLSNCEACRTVIPVGPEDTTLSFLPLSHVFERMAGYYYSIFGGAIICYAERMDTVPQNLIETKPTIVCSVPRFFEKIHSRILEQVENGSPVRRKLFHWARRVCARGTNLEQAGKKVPAGIRMQIKLAHLLVGKKIQKKIGGRLRFFISGGAALSKDIAEFFYGFGVLILEGYGLTETSPVITVNSPNAFKFGSVGRPLPGVEVKIAQDGEILTRGPHIMKGYFKNQAATAEMIRDGWLATGDIGVLDAEGFLKITDRKKDIIVTSGGKNVSPQNIEQTLTSDPLIAQACVIGDNRRYLTALLVPNWNLLTELARKEGWDSKSKEDLAVHEKAVGYFRKRIDDLMRDFPSYSSIKYFTLITDEFSQGGGELTPTMKLKRKAVAQKYADVIGRMYDPVFAGDSNCRA